MIEILRKIIRTGIVTETWDRVPAPEGFRGQLAANSDSCTKCGKCVASCPVGAIKITEQGFAVNHNVCLFCGRCVEICENQALSHSKNFKLATIGDMVKHKITKVLGRSLAIRHVDVGSCNACDWEMGALSNPVYDLSQYGIHFVASPRHADMLMVTGVVTRNLTQALQMTYEATPEPKLVMAVGSCAASGKTFGESYAVRGGVDTIVPVDIYVPGCPPRPQALLYGLLLALDRIK